mgnify:FL=1
MDMYQKREIRKNKKMNENTKSLPSTSINWYPGHMAKTKKMLEEKKDLIDVVLELVDARIPYSSKISGSEDILKTKPHILVMTKSDLADEADTKEWSKYYTNKGYSVIAINADNKDDLKKLVNKINEVMQEKLTKKKTKGNNSNLIHACVLGIPNVGKSTLINRLAGKKVSKVGNNPGITRSLTWLKTNSNIVILDTPGILWPKLDQETVALNLACMSAIKEDILPLDKVACHILLRLEKYYPQILKSRYNLENLDDFEEAYNIIAKKIGALNKGGEADYRRVSTYIINEIKLEKIKNITFDKVEDL